MDSQNFSIGQNSAPLPFPVENVAPESQGRSDVEHFYAAIIGAGFGGLGAAIRLRETGVEDFVVLERDEDVGGTWRVNTYPGCQCDVPSSLYSFSFAPNPDWSRAFAPQAEIEAYLHRFADAYQLRPRIRFGQEVLAARWDDAAALWRLTTPGGELTANILIAAQGALSHPAVPDWPGLERFDGRAFHPAKWDPAHDVTGRRVAVVGTGASAVQVIPAIQPLVKELLVFQRTPPWIVPRMDREIPAWKRRLYRRLPISQTARPARAISAQRADGAVVYLLARRTKVGRARGPRLHGKAKWPTPRCAPS